MRACDSPPIDRAPISRTRFPFPSHGEPSCAQPRRRDMKSPRSARTPVASQLCGWPLEVLARVRDGVYGPAGLVALLAGDERADVDDPLALLAGDPRPVVGVRGVREVLVLLELVDAG